MIHPGYCCINLTLQNSLGITSNRTMRKETFLNKGISYASDLILENVSDLVRIIDWNGQNKIKNFRMSSNMFPWASEYSLEDLPNWTKILSTLKEIGTLAKDYEMRLSFHPGPFVKLGSLKESVVASSIKELEIHNSIMNHMGLEASEWYPINIHVGMSYNEETSDRFCLAFNRLSDSMKKRLVVENDDKKSSYAISHLFLDIHSKIKIPLTLDFFHHSLYNGIDLSLTEEEAFDMAASTWKLPPLFHYSESKAIHEGIYCNPTAHSDYVNNLPNDYGKEIYLDLETKAKELALLKLRENTNDCNIF
jgi:UV DNA damage endonuclease